MTISEKAFFACPGTGALEISRVAGRSTVVSCFASSPLKILTPRSRGQSVWAYVSSFGGGIVGGDEVRIQVTANEGSCCFLSTQASTKIYRNSIDRTCAQTLRATLGPESLFVLAPEVLQPFASGTYSQKQQFHLHTAAGLVLVDWFSAGRVARGERWAFRCFESRNEVFVDGELVFVDSLLLDSSLMQAPLPLGRYNCVALIVIIGQMLSDAADGLADGIEQLPVERCATLIQSVSRIAHGVVLRIAGTTVEEVSQKIQGHLKFLIPLLGDDPWRRKW